MSGNQHVVPFQGPSTICVSGPTMAGKSRWVQRLLEERDVMFTPEPPQKVLYCYGIYQPLFDDMAEQFPFVTFNEGLPNEENLVKMASDGSHSMLILDDLMKAVVSTADAALLFTQGSHHRNMTILFITQNIFCQGKVARDIALNTQYLVLFNNLRDSSQIKRLGQQLYPAGKWKGFMEAYEDSTSKPYGYLLVDLSPKSEKDLRLRTTIFPDDKVTFIYELKTI